MNRPSLWVTPEAELDAVVAREPEAIVLSFGSPTRETKRPAGVPAERFHAFSFNDIPEPREGLTAPSEKDIIRICDLVRRANGRTMVFQCWFGVSRSTAALLTVASALGPGTPADLATRLRAAAPWATPNPLMIALADEQLGLDGRLRAAVEAIGRGEQASTGRAFRFDLEAA